MSEKDAISPAPTGGTDPEFSLILITLNNREELPGFFDSIEKQSLDPVLLELIVVDLGSTDGSVELVAALTSRLACAVSVHHSGSLAAARNAGIAAARGKWISFPEPSALLDEHYLSAVSVFARRGPDATLIAASSRTIESNTLVLKNDHPLRSRFAGGDQFVDLDRFPDYFHRSPACAFFRPELLRASGLQFADTVFSGSRLVTEYLLRCEHRVVGFLASTSYVRRRRSTDQVRGKAISDTAPLDGWRSLLQNCTDGDRGTVPEWVQRAVLDTLAECFNDDGRARGGQSRIHYASADLLRQALDQIVAHLDAHVIRSFSSRGFNAERRDILLFGLATAQWHSPYLVATKYDPRRQEVRVSYRFTGDLPDEVVLSRGRAVEASSTKTRTCEYFGYSLISERLLWVPASGVLRVTLNGEPLEIRSSWESAKNTIFRPARIAGWFAKNGTSRGRGRSGNRTRRLILRTVASTRIVRRRFADSWVLMDRVHEADDNGQRLFEYLRQQRPDINAWFVIEKDTADWHRLRRSEFRQRVVAYGSMRWVLLMLNCVSLSSSHVHEAIRRPQAILDIAPPRWHFTFLQHGVIKDDISRWLNRLDVDLFITSTQPEFDSLAADGTPYVYSTKEVKLTGLPRFDRLRRKANEIGSAGGRYILVCPTWRDWLCKPMVPGTQVRPLVDNFLDSEYVRTWISFLTDPRLAEHAKRHDLSIAFMPHPNFQSALKDLHLPADVQVLTYADNDVQELIARCAVMVTDYSSIAFNAAYIERAVVYFQFDSKRINSGAHNYRPGYFDYRDDAFGPLVDTTDDAVLATIELTEPGEPDVPVAYQQRIDRAFPDRSGGCCARVTAVIETAIVVADPPAGPSPIQVRTLQRGRRWLATHPRAARAARGARSRWRDLSAGRRR